MSTEVSRVCVLKKNVVFDLTVMQLLFVSLVLALFAGLSHAKDMVSIDRPQVNMRSGAGTQHGTLWTLSKGYPLEVTGRHGKWLKVRDFERDAGWVYRPLVNKTPHLIVKSSVANVRRTPSTRSAILGKAEYGDVLRRLEQRQGWVKVERDDGLKGWISRKLLWGW